MYESQYMSLPKFLKGLHKVPQNFIEADKGSHKARRKALKGLREALQGLIKPTLYL